MLGLGSKKAGLTIEQTGVRFIQLKNNKTWELEKQAFLPLEPGTIIENQIADEEKLRLQICQWAEQEGLKGSRVALSVPPSQVIIRKMSIPAIQPKQVQQLVALEVETGLHLPFEEPVYDFIPIGRESQIQDNGNEETVTKVLVFAAPRKLVTEYIEILDEAGIKTDSVEVSATALARMAEIAQDKPFADTMLVHLEQAQLDVYMFREGHPIFMRTINLLDIEDEAPLFESESYLAQKTSLIGEKLSMEQLVEVTAEISRMLNFYQYSLHDSAARITELVVTGAGSIRKQLVGELRQALVELDIHELELESAPGKHEDPALNLYRVAVGAALRDEKNSLIDLLPRTDREAKVLPYALAALLLIWLLSAAAVGYMYVSGKNQLDQQALAIQQLTDDSTLKQLELAKLKGSGSSPAAIIQSIEAAKMDAVEVLDQLSIILPEKGVIRDIAYTQGGTIDLTVDFTELDQVSAYLADLKSLYFSVSVGISSIKRESDTGTGAAAARSLYAAVYSISMQTLGGTSVSGAEAANSIGKAIAPGAVSTDLETQEESVNAGTNP